MIDCHGWFDLGLCVLGTEACPRFLVRKPTEWNLRLF